MQSHPEKDHAGADLAAGAKTTLLVCGIFTTIGLFSPGLVLPQIARSFAAVPNAQLLTEFVGTLASFSFAMGAPIAGLIIARVGCRRVMFPALLIFAISGAMPFVLDDIGLILVARSLLGLALSGIFTGTLTAIGALPGLTRARMFGWFSVAGGATAVVMYPLIGLVGHYGWRPVFLLNLVALPVMALVANLPDDLGLARTPTGDDLPDEGALLNPATVGLLVIAALAGMAMLAAPVYASLYLSSIGVTDTRQIAIPVTLASLAAVFGSAAYGPVQHRLGVVGVAAVATLAMGAALLVAGSTANVVIFSAGIIATGAMVALIAPNISASALEFAPHGKGPAAMGLANGVMFGAQLAFPMIAAAIRARAGLAAVFVVLGMALIAAGLVAGANALRKRKSGTFKVQSTI